ncbi:MAG: sugar ABC transporter substrate-binding protein [Treponema sp.]|nr:sugar ABC transporter substrate-binding protein [Treponema sp.]
MKQFSRICGFALILLCAASFSAFAGGKGEGSKKVGFILPDLSQEFFAYYGSAVKAALEDQGYSVTLTSYNGEVTKAREQIETFATQNVAMIIMMGATPDLQGAFKAVRAAGVKVLLAGNEIEDAYDVCLVADNKQIGGVIGDLAARFYKFADKGRSMTDALAVVYNYGGPDLANRCASMVSAFKSQSGIAEDNFHEIEFVADGGDTTGQTFLENTLTKYPNVKVFMSFSDTISLTALNIMKANGKTGDDYGIFGSDATIQAMMEISGRMGPSIFRGTVSMGDIVSQTTENALKLLRNEFTTIPYRSEGPGIPVTYQNVSAFLPPQ